MYAVCCRKRSTTSPAAASRHKRKGRLNESDTGVESLGAGEKFCHFLGLSRQIKKCYHSLTCSSTHVFPQLLFSQKLLHRCRHFRGLCFFNQNSRFMIEDRKSTRLNSSHRC